MDKLLTIALILLVKTSFGQQNHKIDLDWKLGDHEKLSYLTVMSEIDTSSIELNFGTLFKSFSDSTGKGLSEARNVFRKLNDAFRNVDLVTTLTKKGSGIIDIVMVADQSKNKELQLDVTDSKQPRPFSESERVQNNIRVS